MQRFSLINSGYSFFNKVFLFCIIIFITLFLFGCSASDTSDLSIKTLQRDDENIILSDDIIGIEDEIITNSENNIEIDIKNYNDNENELANMESDELIIDSSDVINSETNIDSLNNKENTKYTFRDVFGTEYEMEINPNVLPCTYDKKLFVKGNQFISYEDSKFYSRSGIDVSRHLGSINWNKVKEQGIEFVIIRIGYRGYGQAGTLNIDKNFHTNIKGAQDAGLDIGVYIYSQAINEEEAIEEARFVLDNLHGYEINLPIVYDPESVLDDDARTDNLSKEQFTLNAIAFCNEIKNAGFSPMIYCNMLWQAYNLDLSLIEAPVWYADYEDIPQSPYDFSFWQYSNTGRLDGIDADVDLDIQMIAK